MCHGALWPPGQSSVGVLFENVNTLLEFLKTPVDPTRWGGLWPETSLPPEDETRGHSATATGEPLVPAVVNSHSVLLLRVSFVLQLL